MLLVYFNCFALIVLFLTYFDFELALLLRLIPIRLADPDQKHRSYPIQCMGIGNTWYSYALDTAIART
jgi:hypothetical protein